MTSETIVTDLIPSRTIFTPTRGPAGFDLKAICVFAACGFFLEKDTYFKNQVALQPFTRYELDGNGYITSEEKYWDWHYSPRDISLKQATEEFAHLFERISKEQTEGRKVILPLSGGLDSRTQAAVLPESTHVHSYSYRFADSFNETQYGRAIAKVKAYPFNEYVIPKGYLWDVIDELAELNGCYSEFTHPRQMAVIDEISSLGEIFFLGHWGDVLFDDMGIRDDLNLDEQIAVLYKKIIKKGGLLLAEALWKAWGLEGEFGSYLKDRLFGLLQGIKIENANARIRAFKSLYWAPRWTTTNLVPFSSRHEIALPYYHNDMCRFICTIPERLLAGRQVQIEYLKMEAPALANISWQEHHPLNLYNYSKTSNVSRLPYRVIRKAGTLFQEKILGKKLVVRNWEIQFSGEKNEKELERHILHNDTFKQWIPQALVKDFYQKFRSLDPVYYSHPISLLLTLSVFYGKYREGFSKKGNLN